MKHILAIGIVALGAVGFYAFRLPTDAASNCTTEELAQLQSPGGSAIARYENMVCTSAPNVLESRVLAKHTDSSSWHLVFRATSPIDPALDRKTKAGKLNLQWIDAATISIESATGLALDTSITNDHFKVLISSPADRPTMIASRPTATSDQSCSRETIIASLESAELLASRDSLFNCLYASMSADETWRVVDAIWRQEKTAYPKLNWEQLRQPEMRLPLAGLWSVLKRRKDHGADVAEARDYVLSMLQNNNRVTRGEAISALGNAGTLSDVDVLASIARTESDVVTAKRALSAIASIEFSNAKSSSRLDEFVLDSVKPELRQHAVQLKTSVLKKG